VSPWISAPESRELVHRWRAESDAIAVGIGTVLADDPLLTARPQTPSGAPFARIESKKRTGTEVRQPIRVVFDRQGRLPLDSQLVRTVEESPVLAVVSPEADAARTAALRDAGVELIVADGIEMALTALGARDITNLFLEGGRTLAAAFAEAGEIDGARVFVAPVLLAGGRRIAAVDPGANDTLIETRLKEW
jgi:diaminohydroxyphosphoribosylaminopyrimidine deaminase / 5-amino-6-(5-phosphoribosylamino)uracil reductase